MSKFKAGDRVAAYGAWDGRRKYDRVTGTIAVIDSPSLMVVDLDRTSVMNFPRASVHPKQCRKLVKKERRRIWLDKRALSFSRNGEWEFAGVAKSAIDKVDENRNQITWIEFVEVRRK